jgi:hypothetical protein
MGRRGKILILLGCHRIHQFITWQTFKGNKNGTSNVREKEMVKSRGVKLQSVEPKHLD